MFHVKEVQAGINPVSFYKLKEKEIHLRRQAAAPSKKELEGAGGER